MSDFLILAFLFIVAGIVAVPIATRLGLGSVLGYLLAGIALGPVLRLLEVDVLSLQHFAEFGVVMMLFLVGLELEPKLLWSMRHRLLGLGGLQVGLTTLGVTAGAFLLGLSWPVALALGLCLALSSTAIVLQTLNEKALMKSDGGQASFSVLLFQDIAVIPMLALLPLLAVANVDALGTVDVHAPVASVEHVATDDHGTDSHADSHGSVAHGADAHGVDSHDDGHGASPSLVDGLEPWQRTLVILGAIGFIILGGRLAIRPLFRFVELAKLRELFTATALLIVIGIALLMGLVGLSAALGTFLAGVILADSEYRHELESDIAPFKGLLLGLFFMTVGSGINFGLLFESLSLIVALTAALMLLKFGILYGLGMLFGVKGSDRWLMALGLAQAGEFAFVLLSFTVANNIIPTEISSVAGLVVALSMLITPLLFIAYDRIVAPRFSAGQDREADTIDHEGSIIIAGHGRVGGIINRIARAAGHQTVVLDYSSEQLDMLRKFGLKVFYGDASRPDLLEAAGLKNAKVLVIAIDDKEQITELTHYVSMHYPDVHIISRATDRNHVYELYEAGSRDIVRETFDSSVRMGRSVLEALGLEREEAQAQVDRFVEHDQYIMRELASTYRSDIPTMENEEYINRAKELVDIDSFALSTTTTAVEDIVPDEGDDLVEPDVTTDADANPKPA